MSGMRMIIRHQTGSRANQTEIFPIDRYESLYLGRDPSCNIIFDPERDDLVSRSHAVIEWTSNEPRRFTISDLLSANGTLVNGDRINGAAPLSHGDRIQLGRNGPTLRVEIENPRGRDPLEALEDELAAEKVTRQLPTIGDS